MSPLERLLKQVKLATRLSAQRKDLSPWLQEFDSHYSMSFHWITQGHGYYQIQASDRWSPFSKGDLLVFFGRNHHTLTHHPKDGDGHTCITEWVSGEIKINREVRNLFIYPLPSHLHLKEVSSEWALNLEKEPTPFGIVHQLFLEISRSRPDLKGILPILQDEEMSPILIQLWSGKKLNEEILKNTSLQRRFKAISGMSFTQLIHRLKLRKSRYLLKTTLLSVESISAKLGFDSDEIFIRKFFERYGTSPMAYRIRKTSLDRGTQSHH